MAHNAQVKDLVQAFVDGELTPSERLRFERQCTASPELRAALRERQVLSDDLFSLMREHRLGRSLRQSVMDNLPEMDRSLLEVERVKVARERRQRMMRGLPMVAALIILVLGITLRYNWPSPQPETDSVGVIVQMSGSPAVYAAKDGLRHSALLAGYVQAGETFESGHNGSLMLRLVGNSSVRMGATTRLRVSNGRDVRLEKGAAFFDVGPAQRLFRVATQDADITVFGTAFEVVVYDYHTQITVTRGEVTVENAHGWRLLRSGESVAVRADESPGQPESGVALARLAWVEQIQPDTDADRLYHAYLADVIPPSIINGVIVHMVDTTVRFGGQKPKLESIRLRWNRGAIMGEVCGYDVYVNDALNNSIFKYRIDDAVFERSDATEYNIPIPAEIDRMPRVFNVRLVPRCDNGREQQIAFQVSAVPQAD